MCRDLRNTCWFNTNRSHIWRDHHLKDVLALKLALKHRPHHVQSLSISMVCIKSLHRCTHSEFLQEILLYHQANSAASSARLNPWQKPPKGNTLTVSGVAPPSLSLSSSDYAKSDKPIKGEGWRNRVIMMASRAKHQVTGRRARAMARDATDSGALL